MRQGARPRVYLAGPMTGLTYSEAADWRAYATAHLSPGIVGVSPMRGEPKQSPCFLGKNKAIMTRDRWDVQCADAVLMNLLGASRVSVGTMIEVGWADAHRVPLVVVREPTNLHVHAMLDEAAGWTVETLDEGLDIIKLLFWKGEGL